MKTYKINPLEWTAYFSPIATVGLHVNTLVGYFKVYDFSGSWYWSIQKTASFPSDENKAHSIEQAKYDADAFYL